MRFKLRTSVVLAFGLIGLMFGLMVNGCATMSESNTSAQEQLNDPSPKVQALIEKYMLADKSIFLHPPAWLDESAGSMMPTLSYNRGDIHVDHGSSKTVLP
ncbi:MAG: hypothetical protein ABR512_07015 [Desulfopila sp.]